MLAGLPQANVRATFPAHCKAYPAGLPVVELPRDRPLGWWPATRCSPAPLRRRPRSTSGSSRGCCTSRPASCAWPSASDRPTLLLPRGGLGRWALPARAVRGRAWRDGLPTACTGTTRSRTRWSQVGPPPAGEATTLVVTGVPWRTGWRYAERGFRHLYWDAGTMLAQHARAGRTGLRRGCARRSRTRRSRGWSAPTACTSSRSRSSRSATASRRSSPAAGGERPIDRRPPVEFPLVTRPSTPATASGSARRGRPARRSAAAVGRPRRGDPAPRSRRASWTRPRPSPRVFSSGRWPPRCAAAGSRTSSPSTASRTSSPASTAGPTSTTPLRAGDLRDELFRLCVGPGPRPRRRVRRHRRGRPRPARRPRLPRGPARARASSRAACTSPPTRSASAPRA